MTTREYCSGVERKELRRKELSATWPIQEDHSPLVSLKESGVPLIFEPAIVKDCDFRVREALFGRIGRIARRLDEQGKVLIIRSVWRSFGHQRRLWDEKAEEIRQRYPQKRPAEIAKIVSHFIAPAQESMHSTGGAVDALVHDPQTDRVMNFGNNVGLKLQLDETCYPHHPGISPEARRNRDLLMGLFEAEGFVVDLLEYWHFDYGNVSWAIAKNEEFARYGVIGERPE